MAKQEVSRKFGKPELARRVAIKEALAEAKASANLLTPIKPANVSRNLV